MSDSSDNIPMTVPSLNPPPPENTLIELEDAWAEYADWRADSAASGIATSFSLRRIELARANVREAFAEQDAEIGRLHSQIIAMGDAYDRALTEAGLV